MSILAALLLGLLQLQIPQPTGFVNDFARVLRPDDVALMTSLIEDVRRQSGGEIAVVTLPDLQGRPAMEVARDIGRQWGVGAQGGAGDRARNAGVVLLLKPGALVWLPGGLGERLATVDLTFLSFISYIATIAAAGRPAS